MECKARKVKSEKNRLKNVYKKTERHEPEIPEKFRRKSAGNNNSCDR